MAYKLIILDFTNASVHIHSVTSKADAEDVLSDLCDEYGYNLENIQYMTTVDETLNVTYH